MNTTRRLGSLLGTGLLLLAGMSPLGGMAQDKPPLKILVGFPPGGSADLLARLVADGLRNDFNPITVDNRPGAGGRIALMQTKAAKPDGQTVIILPSGPMVLFPHVYKKLDYNPASDFTPISLIAHFQFGVVAGPGSTAQTIQQMVEQARAKPGQYAYGTPGLGTLPHFMGVMMEQSAGVQLNHVPFQGGGPANNALLGGHIAYKFDVVSETAELHRTGKARILAVTGGKRDTQVPEVPTLKESGIPMEATAWFGMYAPAGLSPDVLARLENAMVALIKRRDMQDKLQHLGYDPVGSTSAELARTQRADLQRWEKPIKATGVSLD